MPTRRTTVAITLLLVGGALLYTTRLEFAPIYLMQDEVNFSLQAQAIASTSRDTNGRLLPVYFSETGFAAGRDPVIIYAQALVLQVLPLSEFAVRLPTATVGVLNLLLMFLVGRRLFESDRLGLLAAALLAFTPAHFINARLALSILYPIPFILTWLLCLASIGSDRNRLALAGAGVSLGLGVYSYLGAVAMMPIYGLLTVFFLFRRGLGRAVAPALAAFAVAMVPLVWWQIAHPNRYADLLSVYRPMDLQQVRERIDVFWSFFNPDYLFVSGDSRVTNSTRQAGLFPLAFLAFVPIGLIHLARGRRGALGQVVALGFVTAPLASVVSGKLDINRVLFVIPFGVLAGLAGAEALWAHTTRILRWMAAALLVLVPLQFAGVYADYMGPYRVRSAAWFGGNMRTVVSTVLERSDGSAPVFLNLRSPIERHWRFYTIALGRPEMAGHPVYYDPAIFDPASPPAGALLVCEPAVCARVASSPAWAEMATIVEPDGTVSFAIYRKTSSND